MVRRVKRVQALASDGTEQGELFATYRHHGFVTNSTLSTIEADARHRDHAVIEQVIAELKDGPMAHLPSGKKTANSAWLIHAVMAFNLARATGVLASPRHARARCPNASSYHNRCRPDGLSPRAVVTPANPAALNHPCLLYTSPKPTRPY